jgi:hypothetical protein
MQQSQLIPFTIYSFLRIIAGYGIDLGFRKDMASFCASVIVKKYNECAVIGRDLVRLLQEVSRMSEFDSVWKLLNQKSSIMASDRFSNSDDSASTELSKLLKVPSQKRFLSSRLSPEMELNLLFILNSVKYGTNHRRYYEWFSLEYLKVTDPDNLIVDIIRYLIVSYHPPNAVLASSSVQRWQIITWFLRQIKTNFSTAYAKLALFYDWLFYDPNVDNIMNIEPAILIITKSAAVNAKISCTMIEFLYLLRQDYEGYNLSIDKGIDRSMTDIISKRVISNLESVMLSDQIDEEIKTQTKQLFPCYFNPVIPSKQSFNVNNNDSLTNTIKQFQSSFKDSDCTVINSRQIMKELIEFIGRMTSNEYEDMKMVLNDFIADEFSSFHTHSTIWSSSLVYALSDAELDKDILDIAVERITLLPQNCFDIEKFAINGTSDSKRESSSSSLNSFMDSNESIQSASQSVSFKASFDDDQMINGIEDQMRHLKATDPSIFYTGCFTQFDSELSESPNVIDLLYIILEDTDPSQLLQLKSQLFVIARNPIIANWDNVIKSLASTKDWDGYCQIFFWDLMLISLKQFPDFVRVRAGFKEILGVLKLNGLLISDHSEIYNGFLNIAISLKSVVMSSNSCNEYFSWILILLEEAGSIPQVILQILIFYWRSNSRLFLQSLVRIDDEAKQVDRNLLKRGLLAFSKAISGLDENSPAKKSLLSCLETTMALIK